MATGDVTYSHYDSGAVSVFASGTVTTDNTSGNPINVACGFKPSRIELYHMGDDMLILWFAGMTAAYYFKTVPSTGIITLVTSGGPVVWADDSAPQAELNLGFTIPAALMTDDDETIYWVAWR